MGRMPSRTKEALSSYRQSISERFPEAKMEIMPEVMGGFDVWVQIEAPGDEAFEILDLTAELNAQCEARFGVAILATVVGSAFPVPPSGKLTRS